MRWHNKNRGRHPQDPEYIDDYDPEEDYEDFCTALEEREEQRRRNDNERIDAWGLHNPCGLP